jgi:uncharacterized protein
MIIDRLPKRLDPKRFASKEQQVAGEVELSGMTRLAEACGLKSLSGQVKVALQGSVDDQGIALLSGQCQTTLPLICQRCMQPFDYKLETAFNLAPIQSEKQRQQLPSDYEALLLNEDELTVAELVEDELLLKAPLVCMHPLEDCSVKQSSWQSGEIKQTSEEKPNPFAKLSALKAKK